MPHVPREIDELGCTPLSSSLPYLPLPRVEAASLSYARFLREFALPRQPCLITGVGLDWPAATRWASLEYFLHHAGVDSSHEVSVAVGREEREMTVGEALTLLCSREEEATARSGGGEATSRGHVEECTAKEARSPLYLSAWDYVRGNSAALQEDFAVPPLFSRAPAWLEEHVVLGNSKTDLRWLYLGEEGSGSATHVDTNLSSAWLWVARGEKEWVCAHGEDHELLTGGFLAGSDGEEHALPDLFAPDLTRWPQLARCRLYRGTQRPGDVCFNPSRCVHATRNLTLTISLTHNFVDASNLPDVLEDATHSLRTDLLPMIAALHPKKVLRTLVKTLRVDKEALVRTLVELPSLLCPERMRTLVDAACQPEADEASATEVRDLIEAHLASNLAKVREPFLRTATDIREALGLESPARAAT